MKKPIAKYKIVFLFLWVIAVLLAAWTIKVEADKRYDQQVAGHMASASKAIKDYVLANYALPDSLDQLKLAKTEGVTYRKQPLSYQLCGEFKTLDTGPQNKEVQNQIYSVSGHPRGEYCVTVRSTEIERRLDSSLQTDVVVSDAAEICGEKVMPEEGNTKVRLITATVLYVDFNQKTFTYESSIPARNGGYIRTGSSRITLSDDSKVYDKDCKLSNRQIIKKDSKVVLVAQEKDGISLKNQTVSLIQIK